MKDIKDLVKETKKINMPLPTGKEMLLKEVLKKGLIFPKRIRIEHEVLMTKDKVDNAIFYEDEEKPEEVIIKRIFSKIKPLSGDEIRSNSKKFRALLRAFKNHDELLNTLKTMPIYGHEKDNTYVKLATQLKKTLSNGLEYTRTLQYNVHGDFGYLLTLLQNHFQPISNTHRKTTMITIKGFEAKGYQSERKRKEFKKLREELKPDPKEFEHSIEIKTSIINLFLKENYKNFKKGVGYNITSLRELVARAYRYIAPFGYKDHGADGQLDGFSYGNKVKAQAISMKNRLNQISDEVSVVKEINGKNKTIKKIADISMNTIVQELNSIAMEQIIDGGNDMRMFKKVIKHKKFAELRITPKDKADIRVRNKLLKDFIKVYKVARLSGN